MLVLFADQTSQSYARHSLFAIRNSLPQRKSSLLVILVQCGAVRLAAATNNSLYINSNSEHCSYNTFARVAIEPSHHVALPHPTIVHRRQFRARLPPVEPPAAPRHARRCSVRKSNVDATPARWRGGLGLSLIDSASAATPSPRNDLVKNHRVHPTHWLICAQVGGRERGAADRSLRSGQGGQRRRARRQDVHEGEDGGAAAEGAGRGAREDRAAREEARRCRAVGRVVVFSGRRV